MSKIENPFPQLLFGTGSNFLMPPVTQQKCVFLESYIISLPLFSRYLIGKPPIFTFMALPITFVNYREGFLKCWWDWGFISNWHFRCARVWPYLLTESCEDGDEVKSLLLPPSLAGQPLHWHRTLSSLTGPLPFAFCIHPGLEVSADTFQVC